MHNRSVIIFALFTIFIVASCSSSKHSHKQVKRLPGKWQATPIVVDGNNKDWPNVYPFQDDKAMISYAITNDKDNLYITMMTGDQLTAMKILQEGFLLWVDKTGSKEQETAICFPKGYNRAEVQGTERRRGEHANNLAERINKGLDKATAFTMDGFLACNGTYEVSSGDSCGIVVGIGLDEFNQLVWEAAIPFKAFYNKAGIERRDRGKPISICFDIKGRDRPAGNAGGMNSRPRVSVGISGMGGMGMGMGMGGFGGGGRRGGSGRGEANEALYKSTKTWAKVGIAFQ
ncbi:MAG: hypothetical protein WCG87_03835 [Bacteroidota bacterium]